MSKTKTESFQYTMQNWDNIWIVRSITLLFLFNTWITVFIIGYTYYMIHSMYIWYVIYNSYYICIVLYIYIYIYIISILYMIKSIYIIYCILYLFMLWATQPNLVRALITVHPVRFDIQLYPRQEPRKKKKKKDKGEGQGEDPRIRITGKPSENGTYTCERSTYTCTWKKRKKSKTTQKVNLRFEVICKTLANKWILS